MQISFSFFALLSMLMLTVRAEEATPAILVRPGVSIPGCGPVTRRLIGFNLPAGHTLAQTRVCRLAPRGTNGVFEALHRLNPGLVRVWSTAHECGLDTMQLPPYDAKRDGSWEQWLARELADDSPQWHRFDQYMDLVAALGDDTRILLCLPAFPPWIGPFRAPARDCEMTELLDVRTGKTVPYAHFFKWAGMRDRMIVDTARFSVLSVRVQAFTRRLIEHCLGRPSLRRSLAYVSLGNEPDNEAKTPRAVCWRMWVYGSDNKRKMEKGEPILSADEGLLQQLYLRMHAGIRAADPGGRIKVGGPECAWAHAQMFTMGAFYYLGYFIDGGSAFYSNAISAVTGVGRRRIDFLAYHSYSFRSEPKFQHDRIVDRLYAAFGKPVLLTECNAGAGGHGRNFMQSGAAAVADVIIRLGRDPHALGAAFFKASGGGFGLVLPQRDGSLWHAGAYWAMDLCSRWIVGGTPVQVEGPLGWERDCLAVRFEDGTVAAVLLNRTAKPVRLSFAVAGVRTRAEARFIELPLASGRNDYRDVGENEVRRATLDPAALDRLTLTPRGVLFLRFRRR